MSGPVKKKQKIENKGRNVDIKSIELEISKINPLRLLFFQNWFLIEIGRKLLSTNDNDLINILLLNKSINKRVTVVFKEHFLNFPLQKEIFKLLKAKDFDQIQQIFEKKPLSLNPNIKVHLAAQDIATTCYHDRKVVEHFEKFKLSNCTCALRYLDIPLVVFASRRTSEFDSFVKSMLFHPRMKFGDLSHLQFHELLNWSVVRGHFDVCELILKQSTFFYMDPSATLPDLDPKRYLKNPDSMLSRLHWEFAVAAAIIYEKFEILNLLEKYFRLAVTWRSFSIPMLELCSKFGGSKYYEIALMFRPTFFVESEQVHEIWQELYSSLKFGNDFVQKVAKFMTITKHPYFETRGLEINTQEQINMTVISRVMTLLWEAAILSQDSKEDFKIALSFALSMGFEKEFESLLEERDWSERDLLDLFHVRFSYDSKVNRHERLIKMILNRLHSEKPISEDDLEPLLDSLLRIESEECFKFVWQDKRFIRSQKWTNDFVLNHFLRFSVNLLKFLLPQCDLSSSSKFKFEDDDSFIVTQFRNSCLFIFTKASFWDRLSEIEHLISINWTSELLKSAFSLNKNRKISEQFSHWALPNQLIPDSIWTIEILHSFFVHICKIGDKLAFDLLLKRFPNIDLRANNNEAFRFVLTNGATFCMVDPEYEMMERFSNLTNFKFKDEEEKKEMLGYLQESREDLRALILKIKLM